MENSIGSLSSRPMWRKPLVAFWVGHLCLVALSAFHQRPTPRLGPLQRPLEIYQAYTGADAAYGFFSPQVPSGKRMRTRILCQGQWKWVEPELRSAEGRVRLVSVLAGLGIDPPASSPLAASWARHVFWHHPCATVTTVHLEYQAVPSMKAYREGHRAAWLPIRVFLYARSEEGVQ